MSQFLTSYRKGIVDKAIDLALAGEAATPEEALMPIYKAQYQKAKDGDTKAAEFLTDRIAGKPATAVTLGSDPEQPFVVNINKLPPK